MPPLVRFLVIVSVSVVLPASFRGVATAAGTKIVDVIADDLESDQNAEPSIMVNPANPNQAFITAFYDDPNPSGVFFSSDAGSTWSLFEQFNTLDASMAWGNAPYIGDLDGVDFAKTLIQLILRRGPAQPSSTGHFAPLPGSIYSPISNSGPDQPWLAVTNVNGTDHIYAVFNDLRQPLRTAAVDFSLDGGLTFQEQILERGTPWSGLSQDLPPVRIDAQQTTVYAVFERPKAAYGKDVLGDLVVVRDSNAGQNAFTDLGTGAVVASNRVFPQGMLGQERLGSDLSIAASPASPNVVYVACGVSPVADRPYIEVYRSSDAGASWSKVFQTRDRSALPALAVSQNGAVALMYTGYYYGKLETHITQTLDGPNAFQTVTDQVVSRFLDTLLVATSQPYIGDFERIVAVGSNFYGAFSAANDTTLFPQPVVFLRNASLLGHSVPYSIDPFYCSLPAITSTPVNGSGPVANPDTLTLVDPTNAFCFMTENDSDPSGDVITVVSVSQPQHGAAMKVGTGSAQYTPNATFNGTDSFSYTIENSVGQKATSTVTVTAPYYLNSGNFMGVIGDASDTPQYRGFAFITLNKLAGYSGAVVIGASSYRFVGSFDLNGHSVAVINSGQLSITLDLSLDFQTGLVSVTASNGLFSSSGTLTPALAPGKTPPEQYGLYSVGLPHDATNSAPGTPHGDGFGFINLTADRLAHIAIQLPDGSSLSQGIPLAPDGSFPIFIFPYKARGSFSGTVQPQGAHDLASSLLWYRGSNPGSGPFQAGFTTTVSLVGSIYPGPNNPVILSQQSGLGAANFGATPAASAFQYNFLISPQNVIASDASAGTNLYTSLNARYGVYTGYVKPPGLSTYARFAGVLVPDANQGYGYYLLGGQSAAADLTHR